MTNLIEFLGRVMVVFAIGFLYYHIFTLKYLNEVILQNIYFIGGYAFISLLFLLWICVPIIENLLKYKEDDYTQ